MPGQPARNLELGAGDVARGPRAEERDGGGGLGRIAEPPERDALAAGEVGVPVLAADRLVLAGGEAARPLARADEAEQERAQILEIDDLVLARRGRGPGEGR